MKHIIMGLMLLSACGKATPPEQIQFAEATIQPRGWDSILNSELIGTWGLTDSNTTTIRPDGSITDVICQHTGQISNIRLDGSCELPSFKTCGSFQLIIDESCQQSGAVKQGTFWVEYSALKKRLEFQCNNWEFSFNDTSSY